MCEQTKLDVCRSLTDIKTRKNIHKIINKILEPDIARIE